MSETPAPESDPDAAVAIARAELRLRMLEELAVMGMALSKEICVRFIEGPYHPEPRHDPGKAFAAVSRSVRLTLAMQVKVEDRIVALRKGEVPVSPARPSRPKDVGGPPADPETVSERRRQGDSDSDDPEHEADPRERECERLDERDHFRVPVDLSLPPRPGEGRLGPSGPSGVGLSGSPEAPEAVPDVPTPLASRVDPPHKGEGGRETERILGSAGS